MKNPEKSFRKFLILWSGSFISAIGSGLTTFGLGVYLFQQTGKASLMALITLLGFLPALLLSIPAGVLADRYDRRLLMVIGDSFSAMGLLFILFCMRNGEAQIWQICVGITISSVFTSLLEPSYKATISDLLTPEQYSKANGLVQIAGSAKYLVSPILAGLLLAVWDVRLLLILDICTFFVTVTATLTVRKGLESKKMEGSASFVSDMKAGFRAVTEKKGVLQLVIMGALITLCLGFIQTLASPMVLRFESATTLGTLTSVIALGMLASSVLLGSTSIKGGYVKILCSSLFGAGAFMVIFGLRENVWLMGVSGFLFFAMLPFANASLDYLIRINIQNELQGRAWGLIGFISQMGYVIAYAASGLLADYIFTPGFLITLAGAALCVTSVILFGMKSIRALESGGAYEN